MSGRRIKLGPLVDQDLYRGIWAVLRLQMHNYTSCNPTIPTNLSDRAALGGESTSNAVTSSSCAYLARGALLCMQSVARHWSWWMGETANHASSCPEAAKEPREKRNCRDYELTNSIVEWGAQTGPLLSTASLRLSTKYLTLVQTTCRHSTIRNLACRVAIINLGLRRSA